MLIIIIFFATDAVDFSRGYSKEMSEEQGKAVLSKQQCGTYLIRDCHSSKGNFTLMWKYVREKHSVYSKVYPNVFQNKISLFSGVFSSSIKIH